MRPIEEVGLIHGNGWHVTPQTRALYATRSGESRPDYGDYVECEFDGEAIGHNTNPEGSFCTALDSFRVNVGPSAANI